VVVIPVGFVSDHMEVRHDLDVEAAQSADSLGLAFARAATPGSRPRFASMVTELVRERLAPPDEAGPDSPVLDSPVLDSTVLDNPMPGDAASPAAVGDMGVPRQACPADCCRYAAPVGRPRGSEGSSSA